MSEKTQEPGVETRKSKHRPRFFPKFPKLRTLLQLGPRKRNPTKITASDMGESSNLDVYLQSHSPYKTSQKIVLVYTYPSGSDITDLIKEKKEIASYTFRGFSADDLKNRFELATHEMKPLNNSQVRDIFLYMYRFADKTKICKRAEGLHRHLG